MSDITTANVATRTGPISLQLPKMPAVFVTDCLSVHASIM